jgi:spoIIIJ-associated protein
MTSAEGMEFRGKSVEEATEAGLAALKLTATQVEVEVLSRGSRGLLGFGAEDARVRITPLGKKSEPAPRVTAERAAEKPSAPPPVAAPPARPEQPEKAAPARPVKTAPPKAADEPEDDVAAVAVELLQGMLDRMDLTATVQAVEYRGVIDEGQEPPLVLNVEGEDLGILIGRRAETLAAIQYLTRLMINHRLHRWVNIVVDVEGYRARREEQLVRLAERMAERVASSGRAIALEAMPPNERRIIHIALRDHPSVTTESVGEGEHRKVTVIPRD